MEAGELLIAHMGAVAVFPGMTCAGVIHMQIGAVGNPRRQQISFLDVESILVFGNDPIQLTAGDIDSPFE